MGTISPMTNFLIWRWFAQDINNFKLLSGYHNKSSQTGIMGMTITKMTNATIQTPVP